MAEHFNIAGYCRISVDDELERDNVSIENQKSIIEEYIRQKFPDSTLTFYEDRDRSGYTFEQREGYQAMRKGLMSHAYDILAIKDFSRFSRRNSRGLVELEDLRDAGVRIISVGDGIDFPKDDDWLKIQFQFLINEMPVTDTSKKVKRVIRRRQADGRWICAAPYGYVVNKRQEFEIVPADAEIVRTIFRLYNEEGWGYKRIANYLTDQGVPTPRMAERDRKEAAGEPYGRAVKPVWAIVTIQGILDNDFYIGTLRQGKYTRQKINGKDIRQDEREQVVIENHHQGIIDGGTFALTRALREKRTAAHYRGVRKYDNVYSGFLVCGDCGSPMFALSRGGLKSAYTCGAYHRRGRAGCTSHHIRADRLDEVLRCYIRRVMEHASQMLRRLNEDLTREREDAAETEQSADQLAAVLSGLLEELKTTKRQRIRDLMRHPDQETLLEETYDQLEGELQKKIGGIRHQIDMLAHKRSTILQVNRTARTAMEVFGGILAKDSLERRDLELIIRQIKVYEDHLEIQLQPDIDALLGLFESGGAADAAPVTVIQSAGRRPDRLLRANVISEGDPLEIYTSRDGEVIFKKYSLLGGVEDFAAELCETMSRSTGSICAVTDRDTVIAVAGGGKRELQGKRITVELEQIMEARRIYQHTGEGKAIPVCDGNDKLLTAVAAPILAEGDLLGLVLFVSDGTAVTGDTEYKLAQTIAAFLGRHMES